MTNREIIEKSITKAEEKGYVFWNVNPERVNLLAESMVWEYKTGEFYASVYDVIFSHPFARAFWGSEPVDSYGCTYKEHKQRIKDGWHYPFDYKWYSTDLAWGYHLKNMVLEKDPIKYLEKFI